jgi:hypothetical protein
MDDHYIPVNNFAPIGEQPEPAPEPAPEPEPPQIDEEPVDVD